MGINDSVKFDIRVYVSSSQSYCSNVRLHCNLLGGGGPSPVDVTLFFWGEDTQTASGPQFDNLQTGTYDCYGVASGYDTSSFPYTPWYAASNHHYYDAP